MDILHENEKLYVDECKRGNLASLKDVDADGLMRVVKDYLIIYERERLVVESRT